MRFLKNSIALFQISDKKLLKSSYYLIDRIIRLRKNIVKAQPPNKIGTITCKNGCRLGSD